MPAPSISSHHLSTIERNIIAKRKASGDFRTAEFKVTPILNAGGYLGEYFRVEMTIAYEDESKQPTTHHLFMKLEPAEGSWQTDFMKEDRLFEKEVSFYKDTSGVFRKLISTDVYPECFLAAPGKMVLADASDLGYRPFANVQFPLDLEHAKQTVIALARFHSATLIYEEETGRKSCVDFPESTREPCYRIGSRWMDYLKSGGRAIVTLAPHLSKYKHDPQVVSEIQASVEDFMLKLEYYFREDPPYRKVICHGDCWPANVLYKYDSDGKPLSAMLIDFQQTRYSPPACELLVAVYLSLSMTDLKNWRASLLDLYYETIAAEISNAGLDANSVYSRDEFQRTCIYYQVVGVIYALLYFPFSRIGQDRMAKVVSDKVTAKRFYYEDRGAHLVESYKTIPIAREFMDSFVEEMYEHFIKTKRGYTEFTP